MTRYKINFVGRRKDAIGEFYRIDVFVEADSPEAALLKLYDTHEHIMHPIVKEVQPSIIHKVVGGPGDEYDPNSPHYRRYNGD